MKTFSLVLVACVFPLIAKAAVPSGWTDNYAKAVEQAKADNKYLLLDFTGSDWCGFCKLLEKEVFGTPQFSSWAKKNFVLVQLDFPHQTPQSAEIKTQNKGLEGKYRPSGFPTIVILDGSGKERAKKVGYQPGSGAAAYIAALEGEIKKTGPMPSGSGSSDSSGDPNAIKEPSVFKTQRPSFGSGTPAPAK